MMQDETYLSIKDLRNRYKVSHATPWRWIDSRAFPKPVKVGGCTRWKLSDVAKWEADQQQEQRG